MPCSAQPVIAGRPIAPHEPPYIVAEIGVNHDGSVQRGVELIEAAQAAGADAIKLQCFDADLLLSGAARLADYQRPAANDPRKLLRRLQLSIDELATLAERARSLDLNVIVTVFSVELVEAVERLGCDAFKVASPDIVNRPLIEALMARPGCRLSAVGYRPRAESGAPRTQPLILSTGAATYEEVAQAVKWLDGHPHLLMQCVSAYPTPDESAALAGRLDLMRISEHSLGYSDHTTAVDAGGLAVASGARMLEKHITLDRSAPGPDHAASLDPAGFAEYVRLARRAWRMLGPAEKRVLDIEQDVRSVSRQSITAARDLPAGHLLARTDVTVKRPGSGLPPALLDEIIGRALARDVRADAPLIESDVSGLGDRGTLK
jgi:N,N'-diacetyllegionaminate synthase